MALGNLIEQSGSNANTPISETNYSNGNAQTGQNSAQSTAQNNTVNPFRPSVEEYAASQDQNYVPPVASYNPYANGTPENVAEAYLQFEQAPAVTQEYANEWQERIVKDYLGYQADDNYQGHYSKDQTNQLYGYLADKQQTTDYTAWTAPNPDDELFKIYIPTWETRNQEIAEAEKLMATPLETPDQKIVQSIYNNQNTTQAQKDFITSQNIPHLDWNQQDLWSKIKNLAMPGSSATTYDNVPEWAKYIQNIFPSFMAGGAGAMVGSIIPIPGAGLVAGAVVGGLTYLQGVTNVKIPVVSDLLQTLDMPSVWTEQAQGTVGSALALANANKQEGDSIFDVAKAAYDIIRDPDYKYLWDVGKYSYEVSADLGVDDAVLGARNLVAKGIDSVFNTDIGQRDINQISRANIGHSGLETLAEGSQGYKALAETYLPVYREMVEGLMEYGHSEKRAKEIVDQQFEEWMLHYTGTSGLGRDLAASSIWDPENLIPFATGKAAEGIGKATGDVSLQNAGRAAVGNPIIDMLPVGIQQGVEAILSPLDGRKIGNRTINLHGSQGWDTIKTTWGKNLQGSMPVDKMNYYQRMVAGVNDAGTIKGYDALKKGGVVNWIKNLFQTTEETRMLNLSQMTTDFLGSVMFDKRVTPEQLPVIIEQAVGLIDIDDKSPLAPYRNTAVLNTIQEGWDGIKADSKIITQMQNDVANFRSFNTNRDVVKHVAKELGMSESEVINSLQPKVPDGVDTSRMSKKQIEQVKNQNRLDLLKKIRESDITYTDPNTGKVMNSKQVAGSVDKFHNNGRLYSMTYFKADMMEKLSRVADDYNMKKYNIQPDSWASRLSELTKSMQSIALLNFSSSYMVNNFLNNMLTRSVVGIGGIDTDFIKTANDLRGIQFERLKEGGAYKRTEKAINKAKTAKDGLAKIDKLYKDATSEKHILGKILKGLNRGDIEGMETKAAFDIATNRYWDATWTSNIPPIPDAWRAVGITDAMSQQILKMAIDSPNIDVFADKLMGEVVVPGARSTFDAMVKNNYAGDAAKIIKDRFSTMPEVFNFMEKYLETGDVATINKAFDELQNRITADLQLKNLIQQESEFDNLKVRYSNEGFSAVGTAMEALGDLFADIWIDATKQNGTLFLDRVVQNIAEADFKNMYEKLHSIQQADYNIVRGYAIRNIGAMIAGLGLDSDFSKALLLNVMKQFDLQEQYWNANHEVYQKYAVKSPKSPDYDWKYYHDSTLNMLKQQLQISLDGTKEMDAMLVKYLRDNCDPSMSGHIDNYENILKQIEQKKETYNAQQIKEADARMKARNKRTRQNSSHAQEAGRISMKKEIDSLHTQAAQQFKAIENTISTKPINNQPFTLEEALRISLFYEEAKQATKNAGEFLDHYVDKSNPAKQFDPINFENKTLKVSFREYSDAMIQAMLAKDPSLGTVDSLKQRFSTEFDTGAAVPLGAVESVYTNTTPNGQIGTEFKLIDPNANVGGAEFTMAKTMPFYDANGNLVNAGVYHNGNLIGYITAGLQETVDVDGKTYPVIGVSKTDPNTYLVYVHDQIWRINPRNPKNFDFTIYAKDGFHPGNPGSTPTTQPLGTAYFESSPAVRQAINLWREQAIADLQEARTNGSAFGKMTPEQREAVFAWMDGDLRQAYSAQRFQTQRYGETMVDASLLNYSQRYGFDNLLTAIMPYQFWMTRSMANWSKRMISQPKWFAMYSRLEKLIEKNKKDFLPTRLEGLVGIPMPNMGDGLGSSLYMDIANIVLPFKQFYEVADYFIKNLGNIHQNTLRKLDDYYKAGSYKGRPITEEEYLEARSGQGDLYWEVFQEERENDESDTSIGGLLETFLSPSVPVQAIYKHLIGKEKDLSYTPAYQLGTTIKAVGDNTAFQGLTDAFGNALQMPETKLRSTIGLESNPYGSNYMDYYIYSYIAHMATEREITEEQANIAIAEGPGNEIYDEAAHRFLQQQGIRKQGGALAVELGQTLGGNKDTSVGQIAGSALASIFGAKVLPVGEQIFRQEKGEYNQIIKQANEAYKLAKESGNSQVYKDFWKNHPGYQAHYYASEDDPQKRLHDILVDNMSSRYYALPESQKLAVQQALGDRFDYFFLDPDTRATDNLTNEELIQWTRAMEGKTPQFNEETALAQPMQQTAQVKWYASSIEGQYERYKYTLKVDYPGIDEIEKGYYNLTDKSQKEAYLAKYPQLQRYWDYRDSIRRTNPALATFIMQRSAHYSADVYHNYDSVTEAIMHNVNDYAVDKLEDHIKYGYAIPASVEAKLRTVFAALGITNMTYEQWKKSLTSGSKSSKN